MNTRLSIGQSLLDFVAEDDRVRVEQRLRGIREQAVLIGAQLAVHSAPGQGTRVELSFDA